MAEDERVFTIPFIKTKRTPRTKKAKRAITEVKEYISRHMKVEKDKVWIDTLLNEKIWERGIQKPPKRLRVKAVKFEDLVEVSLLEKEEEKEEKETEKEVKEEEKKPIKKEEKKGE